MTDPIPDEAVEAAAKVLCLGIGHHGLDDVIPCEGCTSDAKAALTAAAPLIVAQATADLRDGIEALRDEWRAKQQRLNSAIERDHPNEYARGMAFAYEQCANALDALLREENHV